MSIKTLEELKAIAETAKAEYRQQIADAGKPLADVRAALEQAETDMQAALESGDSAAYTKAVQDADYNRAKLAQMESTPYEPKPLYTDEGYAAYRRELVLAYNAETKPLYEQLQTLISSGIQIVEQIKEKTELNNSVVGSFNATIPANDVWRRANLIARAAGNGVTGSIYDVFHSGSLLQKSLDVAVQTCDRLINENAI